MKKRDIFTHFVTFYVGLAFDTSKGFRKIPFCEMPKKYSKSQIPGTEMKSILLQSENEFECIQTCDV